jgi:hypothetical protein
MLRFTGVARRKSVGYGGSGTGLKNSQAVDGGCTCGPVVAFVLACPAPLLHKPVLSARFLSAQPSTIFSYAQHRPWKVTAEAWRIPAAAVTSRERPGRGV